MTLSQAKSHLAESRENLYQQIYPGVLLSNPERPTCLRLQSRLEVLPARRR